MPMVLSEPTEPSERQAQVGIFYYVWYNTSDPRTWDKTIVDTPLLGKYNSPDTAVISQHLKWIEDLGVDFVILSWWGIRDYAGKYSNYSINIVLETA